MFTEATSPAWKTVGVKGKPINKLQNGKKAAKQEVEAKKKFMEKPPKLEDVLPVKDLANLYSAAFDPPAAKSKTVPTSSPSKVKTDNGKLKPKTKSTEKKQDNYGAKTVDEAAKMITAKHFRDHVALTKSLHPGDQLMWLRDAASYLNIQLSLKNNKVTQADFQHFGSKPQSLLSADVKKVILELLAELTETSIQVVFETLMANLAHDMSKDHSVYGYMIMLQLMCELHPQLCLLKGSSARFIELRQSYQNRPNIGTALLWVIGLGGKRDLSIGLKAWIDFMLTLLHWKNYSQFEVDYVCQLLKLHSASKKPQQRILYADHYFAVFDAVYPVAHSTLNKDLQPKALEAYEKIKELSIGTCEDDHDLFPKFLTRLGQIVNAPHALKRNMEIINGLIKCLSGKLASVARLHWTQMYTSHLSASANLLQYISSNPNCWKKLALNQSFINMLEEFQNYNQAHRTSQKEGLSVAEKSCQLLLKKMAQKNHKSYGFPWKTASLALLIGIISLIYYNVNTSGGYKGSNIAAFVRDVGVEDRFVMSSYENIKESGEYAVKLINLYTPSQIKEAFDALAVILREIGDLLWTKIQVIVTSAVSQINEHAPTAKEQLILVGENVVLYMTATSNRIYETVFVVYGDYLYHSACDLFALMKSVLDKNINWTRIANYFSSS